MCAAATRGRHELSFRSLEETEQMLLLTLQGLSERREQSQLQGCASLCQALRWIQPQQCQRLLSGSGDDLGVCHLQSQKLSSPQQNHPCTISIPAPWAGSWICPLTLLKILPFLPG